MTYTTGAPWHQGKHRTPVSPGSGDDKPTAGMKESHMRTVQRNRATFPASTETRQIRRYDIAALMDDGSTQYLEHKAPADLYLEDVCANLARGSMLSTEAGQTAVEDLQPGDMVKTRDSGFLPVRWISSCSLGVDADDEVSDSWPLRLRADALGELRPLQDLIVSPRFRVLTNHPSCAALFGSSETLAPASDLLDGDTVMRVRPSRDLVFYNLMLDSHQIIEANGLETESYHPGNFGVAVMSLEMQTHLRHLFPHLSGDLNRFGRSIRPILKGFEAEVLRVG